MNKAILSMALTWTELNNLLRSLNKEEDAKALYYAQAGANARWRRRIWGRYSQLRKERERREFLNGTVEYKGPRKPAGKERVA